ncbi:MAG: hypothetical protein IJJ04_03755 [Clostridia bacterium]|nr:hypothetical protein [Clostridia bacterium]
MKKFVKETSKKFALGALAILATIGNASAVPAHIDIPNGEDFQITAESECNIPVKGYQTSKAYTYELNVSWGDMKFVFDRGVYNPNTDKLTKKVRTDGYQYCEAGVDDGLGVPTTPPTAGQPDGTGVGKWCGFNGENNRVNVENKGNGDVQMTVSCSESSVSTAPMTLDNVDMQIGVLTSDIGDTHDNWVMPEQKYTANMQDGEASTGTTPQQITFARGAGAPVTTVIQKLYELNGTQATQDPANEVKFYLNITNEPSQGGLVDQADPEHLDTLSKLPAAVGTNEWEQIGTINLNFVPQQDQQ